MILDFFYIPLFIILAMQFPQLLLQKNEQAYLPILKNLALFHFLLGIAFLQLIMVEEMPGDIGLQPKT